MNIYRRWIIRVLLCMAISVLVVAAVIYPVVNRQSIKNDEKVIQSGEEVKKPVFMYFASGDEIAAAKDTIKKLETEYGDRVVFDIKNVDADKKLLEEFPVKGNTPALIMLKADGDIVNIMFKTSDYDKLKAAVDSAFAEN